MWHPHVVANRRNEDTLLEVECISRMLGNAKVEQTRAAWTYCGNVNVLLTAGESKRSYLGGSASSFKAWLMSLDASDRPMCHCGRLVQFLEGEVRTTGLEGFFNDEDLCSPLSTYAAKRAAFARPAFLRN